LYDVPYNTYYLTDVRPAKNAARAASWFEQPFVVYMI